MAGTMKVVMKALLIACLLAVPVLAGEGFLETKDGVRLYYTSFGEASAEPVVVPLVAWNPEAFQSYLGAQHRFIFYDPRNRGRSQAAPFERVGFEQDLADLEAVRAHFSLSRLTLIGTSYYGFLALRYAACHPERVDRLILVSPMSPRAEMWHDYDAPEKRVRVTRSDREELAALRQREGPDSLAYCRAFWSLMNRNAVGELAASARFPDNCGMANERPDAIGKWWSSIAAELGQWDITTEARSLDLPVFLLHGDRDLTAPLAGSRLYQQLIPRSRLEILPGCGHVPWIGAPEVIFPLVKELLEKR